MPMCFDLFLSTPSARRATSCISHTVWCIAISIHALREEGDVYRQDRGYRRSGISIHALREEGDLHRRKHITIHQISIHALREEGDIQNAWNVICEFISIHALREEGDGRQHVHSDVLSISIHALREEGDSKNGEKHLRFCFIVKRSAQIWKSLSKNIRKKSRNLHRTA